MKIVQTGQRLEYLWMMISASIMNRILTLSAIAMFAVVMGLAAFAPAALAKAPEPHNKVILCHFEADPDDDPATDDSLWEVINPNIHARDKHITNHGDFEIVDQATSDACDALIATNP